jgi:CubicO group peptidase (beta-lactamase class C family)
MIKPEEITKIIEQQSDPEPFSGVVYLTNGEDVQYAQGFGYAIRSEKIPNRTNTRFQMASGCKIFTSAAICRLIQQGKLEIDTLLCDCVEVDFPNYAPEITIRHLLTHSSGITSYFEEDINPDYETLWQSLPQYRFRSPKDFLPLFQHKAMKFSPGERFEYNDGGYILLGLVIESITGVQFSEYVQETVFAPAGMNDSGYFATDQLPERTAYAYIQNEDGSWRTNFFAVPIIGAPDGGAYTTAEDMYRFWKALAKHQILKEETTNLLLSDQIATTHNAPYTHYGYGVWIEKSEGETRKLFVDGYDPGVALRSVVYPAKGIILTLIGNTADALWPLFKQLEEEFGLQ